METTMAQVIAKAKYLRISPQKASLAADLIRGCSLQEAQRRLEFSPKKSAKLMLKTLNSAAANARDKGLSEGDLKVAEVYVNPAPTFKRGRARAQGRYNRILKRNSHITVKLSD